MMRVFVFLILSVSYVSAQCNPVCRNPCNSSQACFGLPCPTVLGLGERAVRFLNYSDASISWTMGVAPNQQISCTVLDMKNYRRLVANLSISYDYASVPLEWTCQQGKGGNSFGRGWVLVYTCQTVSCNLWHEEVGNLVSDPCAVNCTTGTVGDGICNPACNVSACAFDDGDCDWMEINSTNPDQGLSSLFATPSSTRQCYPGCESYMIGDGICQNACALSVCDNDGGDCIDTNPCDSNPCQNGGVCSSELSSSIYVCECPSTFCGPQCQFSIWTQISSNKPTESFCLNQYNECGAAYETFSMCCYGSISNCTGSPAVLASASSPSPNPAIRLNLF